MDHVVEADTDTMTYYISIRIADPGILVGSGSGFSVIPDQVVSESSGFGSVSSCSVRQVTDLSIRSKYL